MIDANSEIKAIYDANLHRMFLHIQREMEETGRTMKKLSNLITFFVGLNLTVVILLYVLVRLGPL